MDVEEVEEPVDFEGVEDIGAYTTVRGIANASDRINLGNSIITGLTFISLLAWVEVIFYDFRHPEDQDLISSEAEPLNGDRSLPRISPTRGKKRRVDFFKFATAITIATVIAIFFFRRFPLRI